jgi:peptide/nickel transport system ATP-binding protein
VNDQPTTDPARGVDTTPGPPVLEVRDLEVGFRSRGGGSARALDGVDLDVYRGEVLAIAGESGCGKTTLARTLLGLTQPSAGTVRFEGSALPTRTRALTAYRRRVQLVLQDPTGALNPRRTVAQAVTEGLGIHRFPGDHRALAAAALARAGLRPPERFLDAYPGQLSGGQRQRVVIAGALAVEPDVLVADEPVSSLDASVRGEILGLLLRLRDDLGLTVVVVTHDLGLAWTVADRLAVMYLGRVVEVGPTEDVLRHPQHPYTRALLSVVPGATDDDPVVLAGEPPDPTAVPTGCRFHPRCPALADGTADAAGVADACRGTRLAVLPAGERQAAACHLPGR